MKLKAGKIPSRNARGREDVGGDDAGGDETAGIAPEQSDSPHSRRRAQPGAPAADVQDEPS